MDIKIYDYLHDDSVYIRTDVFVKEQGFVDEFDDMEKKCKHIVVYDENKPIGNCRFYKKTDDVYAVGRFAVLKAYRGKKIGSLIMEKAEQYIFAEGGKEVVLGAQVRVKEFYMKLGYMEEGEEFLEEVCPHITMRKKLKKKIK